MKRGWLNKIENFEDVENDFLLFNLFANNKELIQDFYVHGDSEEVIKVVLSCEDEFNGLRMCIWGKFDLYQLIIEEVKDDNLNKIISFKGITFEKVKELKDKYLN